LSVDFDYTPPTSAQLQEVQTLWASRDLTAKNVSVFLPDDSNLLYELRIYQHVVGGRTHFGAVTIPKNSQGHRFQSCCSLPDSRRTTRPWTLDAGHRPPRRDSARPFFVVPAFRGVTLIYNGISVSATGDFCDAYDGATDDAIALLNVVEADVPQADFSRVMARGGSRGGNIALLLAVRDPRVTVAIRRFRAHRLLSRGSGHTLLAAVPVSVQSTGKPPRSHGGGCWRARRCAFRFCGM
jgi:hypothetical protein